MFQNPRDEQIIKLLLGFQFDEDLTEKKCKNWCPKVKAAHCTFSYTSNIKVIQDKLRQIRKHSNGSNQEIRNEIIL